VYDFDPTIFASARNLGRQSAPLTHADPNLDALCHRPRAAQVSMPTKQGGNLARNESICERLSFLVITTLPVTPCLENVLGEINPERAGLHTDGPSCYSSDEDHPMARDAANGRRPPRHFSAPMDGSGAGPSAAHYS
jgi:hypothetical protein